MRQNKYGNKKILYNEMVFDSLKELARYKDLELLQKAGEISELDRQVKFELIPAQKGERACNYFADFVYTENGEKVVEDVKSPPTREKPDYVIKRKLMLERHGIRIKEV